MVLIFEYIVSLYGLDAIYDPPSLDVLYSYHH